MIEISSHAELVTRCQGDTLCLWAARGLDGRSRAWRSADGAALAVAGAGLSTRDRIAVLGSSCALVPLVRDVLEVVGPAFRPLGDQALIDALMAGSPELKRAATFGWMDRRPPADRVASSETPAEPVKAAITPAPFTAEPAPAQRQTALPPGASQSDQARPHWLSDAELPEVAALLDAGYASSDARPGIDGVERWAGVRDASGRLVATTALAWSAPDVGYLAGVAVQPGVRSRGLGATVCGFVLAEALSDHGAAALMVDEWNDAAIRLYLKLGMRYRPVAVAAVATV